MVKFFKIIFLAALFSQSFILAQSISVSATTDTTKYKVGDYIKYNLELKYDKNINVELPPVKDSVKVLDFIEQLPTDSSQVDSKIVKKYHFVFSKYDSSQVTIPALKIAYTVGSDTTKRFLATNPVTILVTTLLVNPNQDIKDIKEPMKLPMNWLLIIIIVLLAAALIVALYYVYKYYRKKKLAKENIVPEIIIPPYEIALGELRALDEKELWQRGLIKQYHSEITEIIRKYFESRFNFRALEMTSAEILAVLSYIQDGKKVGNIAGNFFSNADLVKFAKFEPMPKVNEEMMQQAFGIVNSTIPVTPEPQQIVSEEVNGK